MTYATERASVLFGCYRRGDANDPDRYVASIAAVLAMYEPDLIREATDPRTGISTDEKFRTFMPNSGELKAWCDAVRDRRARYAELAALPKPRFTREPEAKLPGRRANVFVAAHLPNYPKLLERALAPGTNPADWKYDEQGRPGIWVGLSWFGAPGGQWTRPEWNVPTFDELRAHYPPKQPAREAAE